MINTNTQLEIVGESYKIINYISETTTNKETQSKDAKPKEIYFSLIENPKTNPMTHVEEQQLPECSRC